MHRARREAQGLEALVAQNLVVKIVVKDLVVLFVMRSVDLDDRPTVETDEIEDVIAEWRLPPKVETASSETARANP